MLAPQKQKLSATLADLQISLSRYFNADKKAFAETVWYALCTESRAARVFFKGIRDNAFTRRMVCDLTGRAYTQLFDCEAVPPVVTNAQAAELRKAAFSLKCSIPDHVPLPKPVKTQDFINGLEALCNWNPSTTVLTDHKGDSSRRWIIRELAKGFGYAFDDVPVEFVHELVCLGWPDAPLRSVSRELDRETVALILREVRAERINEQREEGAKAVTQHLLNRTNRPLVVLSDEQRENIEALQTQIDRMEAGRPAFYSDTQQVRALLTLSSTLSEKALAAELTQQIRVIGREYGIDV